MLGRSGFMFLFGTLAASNKEFYVSLSGNDGAAGTQSEPLATLSRCLQLVPAGGTCYLKGGRYDRDVDQETVMVNKRVTISGEKAGGKPAILDGSQALRIQWAKEGAGSCIHVGDLPKGMEVSQLWVSPGSGESAAVGSEHPLTNLIPLTPARFPNAKLSDDSVFDSAPPQISGRRNGSMLYSTKKSTSGMLIDDGEHEPSLASSGIDFTGMIAVLPLGTMGVLTQGVLVKEHGRGSSSFTYDAPADTVGKGHTNNPYFFEGSCALLDSEGEWCVESGRLRVWLDGCADPGQRSFRGKVRQELLSASQLRSGDHSAMVTLKHLTFWAGSLVAKQTDISMDSVQMLFPTWHRRSLGETGVVTGLEFDNINKDTSGSVSIINSVVAWDSSTVPLNTIGKDAFVSRNLFSRNGYALAESATVSDGGRAAGIIFEHNTITHFNAFAGITPTLTATIAYNHFNTQRPSVDGAAVHCHIKPQNGIMIYRNWAVDMTVKAFRFDRVNSATATWGVNGTVVGNVAFRTGGPMFKGDEHHISNNLCLDVTEDKQPALAVATTSGCKAEVQGLCNDAFTAGDASACSACVLKSEDALQACTLQRAQAICSELVPGPSPSPPSPSPGKFTPALTVMMYDPTKSWSKEGENDHTEVKANVADSIFNVSGKLPGIHSGNVVGALVRPMLVNPDGLDFRPRAGSPAVGAGPYPDPSADYWVPGHDGTSDRLAAPSVVEARAYYENVRMRLRGEVSIVVV